MFGQYRHARKETRNIRSRCLSKQSLQEWYANPAVRLIFQHRLARRNFASVSWKKKKKEKKEERRISPLQLGRKYVSSPDPIDESNS